MSSRIPSRTSFVVLLVALLFLSVSFHPSVIHGQIFNGDSVVTVPSEAVIISSDILPSYIVTTDEPKPTATSNQTTGGKNSALAANGTTTAIMPPVPSLPPSTPTTPSAPAFVQPYTTPAAGGFPLTVATPLPLPTTPAQFPQNISSCPTCYGMFPTLSRCNVIANSNGFATTPNATYEALLPFLKCICTFKALDAYPYCIDCFSKTSQQVQLNALQANHLENYVDAFRQLCGATYNGNKVPDINGAAVGRGPAETVNRRLIRLISIIVMLVLNA